LQRSNAASPTLDKSKVATTPSFQRSTRPEQADQGAPDQPAKIAHRVNYRAIRHRQSAALGSRQGQCWPHPTKPDNMISDNHNKDGDMP